MRNIKIALWGFLLLTTGLWLLADTLWPQPLPRLHGKAAWRAYEHP